MDVNYIKVFENTSFVQECFELDKKIFLDNYSLQMINDDSLKELFFLKKDEELIGFIYLHGDDFEKEIYKIGIIQEYQGKGLGKYFLEEVIKLSKTSRLLLEVNSTNKNAIKLYESCNFKKYYIRKKYYSDGNDAILMELKLGELL